jgi:hypothetical protein
MFVVLAGAIFVPIYSKTKNPFPVTAAGILKIPLLVKVDAKPEVLPVAIVN